MTDAARRLSLRTSVVMFVAMSGVVVAAAMGLLILIDPRTQSFWGGRLAELTAGVRTLFGR
ncbi:MAG: hypothetical protein H0U00_13020 [Actinobacteria bacterium]|nr:hypothetical protein [Actinomycetota bacterium]